MIENEAQTNNDFENPAKPESDLTQASAAEGNQKPKSVWTEVVNQTLDQLKERSKEMQSKLPGNNAGSKPTE